MGRELQKKKRRSMRQPVRPKKPGKVLNPRGNNIIAKNWYVADGLAQQRHGANKKETLAQNYRRLGLVARLKAPAGGTERKLHGTTARTSPNDAFAIATAGEAVVSEARVERDADGRIVRVLGRHADNPLNDPLAALDSDSEGDGADEGEEWGGIAEAEAQAGASTDVVRSLIEESRNPAPKKPRHQSEGEREWLERLVAKHGDNTRAMARDTKLNPMQQTAADLAKRIRLLKSA
ncbi:Nucleolar protein 16 [Tolypocladium paradoxum]|uniref:Nucleolar protein 16 n=1 Tax=Tolypocladium paradoxum TaxID=94208 RepID=A0A2S4L2X8_9HYPO|nr:Nucleolar protein 16 [Tolypocladium paradoxum]